MFRLFFIGCLCILAAEAFTIRGKPPPIGVKYACISNLGCEECLDAGCLFSIKENGDTWCGEIETGILYKNRKAPPNKPGRCVDAVVTTTTTTTETNLPSAEKSLNFVLTITIIGVIFLIIISLSCCVKGKGERANENEPPQPPASAIVDVVTPPPPPPRKNPPPAPKKPPQTPKRINAVLSQIDNNMTVFKPAPRQTLPRHARGKKRDATRTIINYN